MEPKADLAARRWDQEYRQRRYEDEPPIPFVGEILTTLQQNKELLAGPGLYVGCGNGRNYLPLIDGGAKLHGLDISEEAIKRLRRRRPDQTLPLAVGDFGTYSTSTKFAYLIAIQVFQHGDGVDADRYFRKTASLLPSGGLFFLRVNAIETEITHRHTVMERNQFGGMTICYDEGPKQGLPIHFFAGEELLAKTAGNFETVLAPRDVVMQRAPPKSGSWTQWEAIWRRR